MLIGRELTLLLPRPGRARPGRGAPSARLGSMFGYGLAYAVASLSCTIGPFLAVTAGTFRGGSVLAGLLAYLAYGTGMALVVGVLAVATALASTAVVQGARQLLPYINRISGVPRCPQGRDRRGDAGLARAGVAARTPPETVDRVA